jgi:hypothetical protein
VAKAERHELADAAFADLLERDVLPEWRAAEQRLANFGHLPALLQHRVSSVVAYLRLRQQAWELFVEALREGDQQKAQRAMEQQRRADEAAQRIINELRK